MVEEFKHGAVCPQIQGQRRGRGTSAADGWNQTQGTQTWGTMQQDRNNSGLLTKDHWNQKLHKWTAQWGGCNSVCEGLNTSYTPPSGSVQYFDHFYLNNNNNNAHFWYIIDKSDEDYDEL